MSADSFNRIPPYGLVRDWLGKEAVDCLLAYAQSNQHLFEHSNVGHQEAARVDHTRRHSKVLLKLGDTRNALETKLRELLPGMFERLGSTPFIPSKFELELVAHGNGAFFSRHVDTFIKRDGVSSHRIISAVYYFHALPKAFTGGVLRLHSLSAGGQQGTFVDIEPDYDMLVFFPSWFPHEVSPVHCPSRRFMDSRFAVNCWVLRN